MTVEDNHQGQGDPKIDAIKGTQRREKYLVRKLEEQRHQHQLLLERNQRRFTPNPGMLVPKIFQKQAEEAQVSKTLFQKELERNGRPKQQSQEEQQRFNEETRRSLKEEVLRRNKIIAASERHLAEFTRDLTKEEKWIVVKALYQTDGPETEVIAKVGTDTTQRASIQRLQPGAWLNDEVIHHYLILLGLRDEQLVNEGKRSRRSHFFNSYFMTKLTNDGDSEKDGVYEYSNVKSWSKNVPGTFWT
jgi:Ulp1 family protease